jgi:hypothetical protein
MRQAAAMTLDAPVMRPARQAGRSLAPFVIPGVVLLIGYGFAGTWSVGAGFGGYGADGGWVDFDGNPTATAPLTVDVVGRPALWVQAVIVGVLVATAVWASRTPEIAAFRRRAAIGVVVATAFTVAIVLVFSVWQGHLVEVAFAHGDPHPPILGNVDVRTGRMAPG